MHLPEMRAYLDRPRGAPPVLPPLPARVGPATAEGVSTDARQGGLVAPGAGSGEEKEMIHYIDCKCGHRAESDTTLAQIARDGYCPSCGEFLWGGERHHAEAILRHRAETAQWNEWCSAVDAREQQRNRERVAEAFRRNPNATSRDILLGEPKP